MGEGLIEREPDEANENGKPRKNYEITPSLRKIQNFYIELFAELMRSAKPVQVAESKDQSPPSGVAGDNFVGVYYDIPIETNRVSCCNIYVTSAGNIGDVRLFDPSGAFTSAPKVSIKKDSDGKYAILSLWSPGKSVWRVGVTADAPLQVQYVPISALKIITTPLPAQDGEVEIEIRAFYDNEDITGDICSTLAGAVDLFAQNRTRKGHYSEIFYSGERGALVTKIPAPEPGRYMLYTQLAPSLTELKVSQRPWDYAGKTYNAGTLYNGAAAPDSLEVSVAQGEDIGINLEDAFPAWDNKNALAITGVECSDAKLPVEIDGNSLKIQAKKSLPTTIDLVAHAKDNLTQQTWDIPVKLDVTWNPMYFLRCFWWVVPLLVALIVAIIFLISVRRKKNPPPPVPTSTSNPPPPTGGAGVNLKKTVPLSNSQSPAGGAGVNLHKRP